MTQLTAPSLSSPADAATGASTSASLNWLDANSSPNESHYYARIKASGGSYSYYQTTADATSVSAATALGASLSASTTYYWSVQAQGNGSTTTDSNWPADHSFTTAAPAVILSAPSLSSPLDTATSQPLSITLRWSDANSSPNESSYYVRIKASGGSYQYYSAAADSMSASAATAFGSSLANSTTYYWSVQAKGNGTTTSDSAFPTDISFTTLAAAVALNAPTLSSPGDAATGQSTAVLLQWSDANSSPNESHYYVRIKALGGSYSYYQTLVDAVSISAPSALGTALAGSTTYYWSVQAQGNGSTTSDSSFPADRSFVTSSCAPAESDVRSGVSYSSGVCLGTLSGTGGDASFTTADRSKLNAIYAKLPDKSFLIGSDDAVADVATLSDAASAMRDVSNASPATGSLGADLKTAASGTVSASGIRTAIGLSSANLDTQLGGISTRVTTGIPNAAPGASGGLPTTNGNKLNQTADLTAGQAATVDEAAAAIRDYDNTSPISGSLGADIKAAASGAVSATNIRNAIGLTAANLDTQLGTISSRVTTGIPNAAPGTSGGLPTTNGTKLIQTADLSAGQSIPVPTAAEIATAVRDVNNVSPASGSLGSRINSAASAGDPWSTVLPGGYSSNQAGSIFAGMKAKTDTMGGAGSVAWTWPVINSTTNQPISGVKVWITTDSAGINVIATGTTDQYGNVTFQTDPGRVYVWSSKTGYSFYNPKIKDITR